MADKYLKSNATPLNWNDAASWESSPGQGDNAGVPGNGDDVYIEANSASLNIDVATEAVAMFIVNASYAGTISVDNQLDVQDVAQLGGADVRYEGSADISVAGTVHGTASADAWANYTGKLVHDGTSGTPGIGYTGLPYLPDFEVNPGGDGCTPTAQVDLSLGSFTGTSGAFDDNDKTITVRGGCEVNTSTNFTLSSSGIWDQVESGNLKNPSSANAFRHLKTAYVGKTNTLTGNCYAKEWTLGAGTINSSTTAKVLVSAPSDDPWHQDADSIVDCDGIYFYGISADFNVGFVRGDNVDSRVLLFSTAYADITVTLTDRWYLGSQKLSVEGYRDGYSCKLACEGHQLVCGDISLGYDGADKGGGKLDLGSGRHRITGTVKKPANSNAEESEIDFGSANVELEGGTIDGSGITLFSNTSGVVIGGTINNVNLSGKTALEHYFAETAGSGNTNVNEVDPLYELFGSGAYAGAAA